jgi:nicotinamide phosphoribosyltransferase
MTINLENFILKSDAYKQSHHMQYPNGTKHIYSYYESRGGEFDETLFFGLQYILKRHFVGAVVTQEMVDEAENFCKGLFGNDVYFNRKGWDRIVNVHGGKLPIEIKAIPEGTVIGKKNILMSVINTDPEVPFITNFVETILTEIWYPISVATTSYQIKKVIQKWAAVTGGTQNPFHLNDFGFRGSSSFESAGIGGLSHLVNFLGTDTLAAIQFGMKYYGAKEVCGHSVFATEHSTTTIYGRENEHEAFRKFLKMVPDNAIASLVSDSYNIWAAVDFFGTEMKQEIMARKGRLVVRPDSGNPITVSLGVVQKLWEYFGEFGTINAQGFKTLPPQIGVIYGDGINIESIDKILALLAENKFTVDNIVFGSGGALLQKVDRDTHKFAFKCCAANIDDNWVDVYKDPITDSGKASKKGRLKLVADHTWQDKKIGPTFKTVRIEEPGIDYLKTVFLNGELVNETTLNDVRGRAK